MLIDKPGKIADSLYFLGQKPSIVYMVKGERSMLIGGGMSWLAPYLDQQFNDLQLDTANIRYLVIQHSHFDHVGAVPYLKMKLPNIKVLATEAAKKILAKENVIKSIASSNNVVAEKFLSGDQCENLNLHIDKIEVDETVNDSTVIDLGDGLDVHFIETPGHSRCTVSVYIPKLKAIFPTDSAPWPIGGTERLMIPSPQYDYSLYRQSLQKLSVYDIDICGFEHNGAVVGSDARSVLLNGQKSCDEYVQHIVDLYNELGNLEEVAKHECLEMLELDSNHLLDENLWLVVSRVTTRNILIYAGKVAE